jgi:hypothetical protein
LMGRAAEPQAKSGGGAASQTRRTFASPSPPGRYATTLPMKGRENFSPERR